MTIRDGSNPAPAQEIKATVDPVAVAQIVRQMQQADAAKEQKESRFQNKVKSLLASGNVDKDNLAEITALQQAAIDDLKDELTSKNGQTNAEATNARYKEAVSDALDKYIEGDDQLEETAELLEHKVLQKLGKDPQVMAKFNAGQLDRRTISNTAKEVVEEFSKKVLKRDKSSKGPTINSGIPSSVANSAIENSPPAGSIDDIAEPHRREAYFKLKGLFERSIRRKQLDGTAMTADLAARKAYSMATKQYKKTGTGA